MEHHSEPLLSRKEFLKRVYLAFAWAGGILFLTILGGAAVYRFFDQESWIEGIFNAVMVMTGVGLTKDQSDPVKLFTSFYAIFSTIAYFFVLGIIFTPLLHRFLHKFHLDLDKENN